MLISNNLIVTKLTPINIEMLIKSPLKKFVYLNNRFTFKYSTKQKPPKPRNSRKNLLPVFNQKEVKA